MMSFLEWLLGRLQWNTPDGVPVRYKRYRDTIDLAGQNIIALSGATREDARRLIPFLVAPDQMQHREVPVAEATATMIPEVADEIHEFTRVTQGGIKVRRLLLRDGVVIELMLS
jgi:hypothetical protein